MRFMGPDWMNYLYATRFEQCQDHNGKIYDCLCLCVGKRGRGKGLGDRLVKRSIELAKEQECSHAHTCVTGIFSQKIFQNNGFDVLIERSYEDFKDKHGKVLVDREPHKVCQVRTLKLNK